ncbi:beta strand repeat-containing protein, partial [Sunxiuqinia sp. sy24]|uniref:beta strand repeat-containing protein n=1 Tax=Sunxiuqinia sp. sy24 TaxID=3461495 RepID=UPI004045DDD9
MPLSEAQSATHSEANQQHPNANEPELIALATKKKTANPNERWNARTEPLTETNSTPLSNIAPPPPTSTGTGGLWSASSSWDGAVPTASEEVFIATGTTITIDAAATCQNITIQTGGSLVITNGATLTITGDWTNNGTFTANDGTVAFNTHGSTITGATSFNNLLINAGEDVSSIIAVNSDITVNNLQLEKGLLQVNGGTTTITRLNNPGITTPTSVISAKAGLEVNTGGTITTGDFTINNKGLIRVNGGTANFGNSSGNSVETNTDGVFEVSDGTVNIAGRLHNSAGGSLVPPGIPSGINISGGIITLATEGNGLGNTGSLNVTAQGAFNFTSGTIIFEHASTASAAIDMGLSGELGDGAKSITNGVFQFGNTNTTSNSTFVVNSEIAIPNISTWDGIDLELAHSLEITNSFNLGVDSRLTLNDDTLQIPATTGPKYEFRLVDNGELIPIDIQITGGSGPGQIALSMGASKPDQNENSDGASFLNRYWDIDITGFTGSFSYDVFADFVDTDIHNSGSSISAAVYSKNTASWEIYDGEGVGSINTTLYDLIAYGITDGSIILSGINSAPTVSVSSSTNPICSAQSTTLTANATGDPTLTYAWTSDPSGSYPTTAAITVSPSTNTTYTVTVTDANGLSAQDQIDITVDEAPVIAGSISDTDVEGCGLADAPAATTVAELESMGLTISDDITPNTALTVTSSDVSAGTCPIVITRTYTVTDECTNSVSTSSTITLTDNVPPVFDA